MIWLGDKRGNLADWTTQRWVCATGRLINMADSPWLDGPIGNTLQIGKDYFETLATRNHLRIAVDGVRGLIADFQLLNDDNPDLAKVSQPVRTFYEQTSQYDLDVWSEWSALFRPFGKALSILFSRRLQQLNVPLSALDSARGMTSNVIQLLDPATGIPVLTAWLRELHATGNVLYAGAYSVTRIPGHPGPCVKVVFPLPNGSAIVIMKAEGDSDGSLRLRSFGKRFGEPGFYFLACDAKGRTWSRYVASMQEEIRVYAAETDTVRADHRLWLWGRQFLQLHYRMRRRLA